MKPIHISLRKEYCSDSRATGSANTHYITLNLDDVDHDGSMSVSDTLVIQEENLDDGEFWRDEYVLNATDVASPENFCRLIQNIFSKQGVNKSVTLGLDASGIKDKLLFIAPPVHLSDDQEIQATFDLSDGEKR